MFWTIIQSYFMQWLYYFGTNKLLLYKLKKPFYFKDARYRYVLNKIKVTNCVRLQFFKKKLPCEKCTTVSNKITETVPKTNLVILVTATEPWNNVFLFNRKLTPGITRFLFDTENRRKIWIEKF